MCSVSIKCSYAALNVLKCWLDDEDVVLWTKDAVSSVGSQPVSQAVQACSVDEALSRTQQCVDGTHTLITRCSGHADAARSLGAGYVLVDAGDTVPDVAARIVTQLVASKKVRI